jgi:hypothetical protein
MEGAERIFDYLPYSYASQSEEEYIQFLNEAFYVNYEAEKYQFAFLAYHMLFMSFVYCIIWKIKSFHLPDFQKALIGFDKDMEKEFLNASSPFTFHSLNERRSFRLFKLLGCPDDKIGNYQKVVVHRNKTAHSNGNIFLKDSGALEERVLEMLSYAEEIHGYWKPVMGKLYGRFLLESKNPNGREYYDPADQLNEVLIRKHYLSAMDIRDCSEFDLDTLGKPTGIRSITKLHRTLKESFSDILEVVETA